MTNSPYKVLAVRHRPRKLEDIVGQETAVRSVMGYLQSGKVPQTIMISGSHGSGKTTLARTLVRYLNCANPIAVEGRVYGDPCGTCWSCKALDAADGQHVDVHEINAAEARGIDDVRSWIDQSKFKPRSRYRAFIIDEAHCITGTALSAFLKPMEEPPKAVLWILCTTDPGRLLTTAKSRVQSIRINDVSVQDCAGLLKTVAEREGFTVPEGDAVFTKIADAAYGHPRDALQILESVMNLVQYNPDTQIDIESFVLQTAKEVIGEPPELTVRKFLTNVYWGKYTIPLTLIQNLENPQNFVENILTHHIHTTKYTVSNKLWDKYFIDYYKKLEEALLLCNTNVGAYTGTKEYVHLNAESLAALTDVFFEALTQLKTYSVDPNLIIFRMTVRSVDIMRNMHEKYNMIKKPVAVGVKDAAA